MVARYNDLSGEEVNALLTMARGYGPGYRDADSAIAETKDKPAHTLVIYAGVTFRAGDLLYYARAELAALESAVGSKSYVNPYAPE